MTADTSVLAPRGDRLGAVVRDPRTLVAVDLVVAAVLVAVSVAEATSDPVDGYTAGPVVVNVLIGVVVAGSVALRRLFPVHVLAVQVGLELGADLLVAHDSYFWSTGVPMALATYTVARSRPWPLRWWWWLPPLTLVLESLRVPSARDVVGWCTTALLFLAVAAGGRALRDNAERRRRLRETLEALVRRQQAREQSAVQDERRRIRREVDDVLAHVMGEMVLQVGAARVALQGAGLDVPDQLTAAEATGRRALQEMSGQLGSVSALAPLAGLDDVRTLVDDLRATGVPATYHEEVLPEVPANLQATVHRIVQEALTNVVKHAGPVPVVVQVSVEDGDLVVSVVNEGGALPEPRFPSGGRGLAGLRERAAVFGGVVEAVPTVDGFAVRATLPLRPTAARPVEREVAV